LRPTIDLPAEHWGARDARNVDARVSPADSEPSRPRTTFAPATARLRVAPRSAQVQAIHGRTSRLTGRVRPVYTTAVGRAPALSALGCPPCRWGQAAGGASSKGQRPKGALCRLRSGEVRPG
jgi:hypothetical protein